MESQTLVFSNQNHCLCSPLWGQASGVTPSMRSAHLRSVTSDQKRRQTALALIVLLVSSSLSIHARISLWVGAWWQRIAKAVISQRSFYFFQIDFTFQPQIGNTHFLGSHIVEARFFFIRTREILTIAQCYSSVVHTLVELRKLCLGKMNFHLVTCSSEQNEHVFSF